MTGWGDLYRGLLVRKLGAVPDGAAARERYAWVERLHGLARELLEPARLRELPAAEVYAGIKALAVPQCHIRPTNLGRENQASDVVEMLLKLLETPGDFAQKYRAAKVPQAGVVTITELLCLAKPQRFAIRNAAFTRAVAKAIPFYTRRAVEELVYEDFLDFCRELAKVQEAYFAAAGLGEWALAHRFLLLYAILTEE